MKRIVKRTPEKVADALQLRASGATYNEIATKFGISKTTAALWTNEKYAAGRVIYAKHNYVINSDKLRDGRKRWRLANPLHEWLTQTMTSARRRAGLRQTPCTITRKHVYELYKHTNGVCPVLGIPIELGIGKGQSCDNSPSLDCFETCKGYVPGNVHIISQKANQIKNNATTIEVQRVAAWMVEIDKR